MHDIGKIGIPDSILLKPGSLTEQERAIMKTHTTLGKEFVQAVGTELGLDALSRNDILLGIVELHHERLNGTGYPHGLKGDQVPLEARIVAVADIFDSLAAARPYKTPWTVSDAVAQLLKEAAEGGLDADCVQALLDNLAEVKQVLNTHPEQ